MWVTRLPGGLVRLARLISLRGCALGHRLHTSLVEMRFVLGFIDKFRPFVILFVCMPFFAPIVVQINFRAQQLEIVGGGFTAHV